MSSGPGPQSRTGIDVYDTGANQLVIPMNANNGLAFFSLK